MIPLSKFVGEPPDILERLSHETPINYPNIKFDEIQLNEEYKRNQELKKQAPKEQEETVGVKSSDK